METISRPDAPTAPMPAPPDEQRPGRVARELRRALIDTGIAPEPVVDIVGQPADRLAVFTPVLTAMRLATTAASLLMASSAIIDGSIVTIVATAAVACYATIRCFRPLSDRGDVHGLLPVLAELALHVGVVGFTGSWDSPFVVTLITTIVVAGFARGYAFAVRISVVTAVCVSLPALVDPTSEAGSLRAAATWTAMLLTISIVAGYGRRISGAADRERDLALDRLGRLADANALLYSLHRVAQTLPASLDMGEVLDSTVTRLRGLVDFDSLVILLFDDTDGQWAVLRKEGCSIGARLAATNLPIGLRRAITEGGVISIPELGTEEAEGFDDRSGSGLYATLTARGSIMGLIALEHRDPNRFDHRAGGLLSGFIPPLSLALDNARWFARLRTVGADEERTRIARDLHDRIGQSLAYLAFELDRIVNRAQQGEQLDDALEHLRNDVRGVIREVRDTLYDLRTDVSDEQSLASILRQYAERVSDRTGLEFQIDADAERRLPLLQEREMWRIAQEAITNIERHADAQRVRVTWRCDGGRAAIRITDDGVGFEAGRAGRLDSYGMLGMRERAASVGASLDVQSIPGQGTSITCVLDPTNQHNSDPSHRR